MSDESPPALEGGYDNHVLMDGSVDVDPDRNAVHVHISGQLNEVIQTDGVVRVAIHMTPEEANDVSKSLDDAAAWAVMVNG